MRSKENANNTSGYLGVNWSKEKEKWHAKIGYKNDRIHLGYFKDAHDAHLAYMKARRKFFLSPKKIKRGRSSCEF